MENTNLTRKQQKIFAGNTTVSEEQIAIFGSKANTGTMEFSKDPDIIQNEYYSKGWQTATLLEEAPLQEDFNAIDFVESYNLAYLFQKGIPEYSENTTYFKGSICLVIDNDKPTLYYSKTDNNTGNNPATDSDNWANYTDIIAEGYAKADGSNATFDLLTKTAKTNILNFAMPIPKSTEGVGQVVQIRQISGSISAPAGGTWFYHYTCYNADHTVWFKEEEINNSNNPLTGICAGGTLLINAIPTTKLLTGFFIRIA